VTITIRSIKKQQKLPYSEAAAMRRAGEMKVLEQGKPAY